MKKRSFFGKPACLHSGSIGPVLFPAYQRPGSGYDQPEPGGIHDPGAKWSLHLPVQYNPFRFSKNRQFRNLYVAPGVRYWLLESYMGPFIGMHGTAGTYSVGNLFGSRYRYEGEGYGVGVSIGKAYQLSTHWNVEWEVGAGAVWLGHDKYLCKRCGDLVSKNYGWHFLPTRAAVNLVYLF